MVRETIYALDGKKLNVTKLATEDFLPARKPRISIATSPSLPHAIITVSTAEKVTYCVVTLHAGALVVSTDLASAFEQGNGFDGWTTDGTAFFTKDSKDDLTGNDGVVSLPVVLSALGASNNSGSSTDSGSSLSIVIQLDSTSVSNLVFALKGENIVAVKAQPAISPGSVGLELMPTNGNLRQVRFPGYWTDEGAKPTPTALTTKEHTLAFRDSKSGTRALWLTPNEKDPKFGILVSLQAESAWLHPDGHTAAFTVNGVLFVKTVRWPAN